MLMSSCLAWHAVSRRSHSSGGTGKHNDSYRKRRAARARCSRTHMALLHRWIRLHKKWRRIARKKAKKAAIAAKKKAKRQARRQAKRAERAAALQAAEIREMAADSARRAATEARRRRRRRNKAASMVSSCTAQGKAGRCGVGAYSLSPCGCRCLQMALCWRTCKFRRSILGEINYRVRKTWGCGHLRVSEGALLALTVLCACVYIDRGVL